MERYVRKIVEAEAAMKEEEQPLYHTNCAENLFRSANEKYGLGVEEAFVQAIIPFGAGMQTENTCGALLGSLSALGLLYGEAKPTENKKMKAAVIKYVELFSEKYGCLKCEEIKKHFRDENDTCTPVKVGAGEILDEVVANIEAIYAEYLEKEAEEE